MSKLTILYHIEDSAYSGDTSISGLEELRDSYGNFALRKVKAIARKYRTLMDEVNRESNTRVNGRLEIELTNTSKVRKKPEPILIFPIGC